MTLFVQPLWVVQPMQIQQGRALGRLDLGVLTHLMAHTFSWSGSPGLGPEVRPVVGRVAYS